MFSYTPNITCLPFNLDDFREVLKRNSEDVILLIYLLKKNTVSSIYVLKIPPEQFNKIGGRKNFQHF